MGFLIESLMKSFNKQQKSMKNRTLLTLLTPLAVTSLCAKDKVNDMPKQPNVVFIYADDLG